jgi:DNA polymerase-3 subunit delta'
MSDPAFNRLPWQQEAWQRLITARNNDRLPHALLLVGAAGLGKWQFAKQFAHSLLCKSPDSSGSPCGHCQPCHLFNAGTHSDLQIIEPDPESKSGDIRIDDIRQMSNKEAFTAQAGGYKVILIHPAERMTTAAANSLLKTLEEPTAQTRIILVSSHPHRLPATVRSRCQSIHFTAPTKEEATHWLQQQGITSDIETLLGLSGGAPLTAKILAQPEIMQARSQQLADFLALSKGKVDLTTIAASWAKLDQTRTLTWLSGWLIDIIRLQAADEPNQLFNPDQRDALHTVGKRLKSKQLHQLLEAVHEARRLADSTLNPQLVLEDLLIRWSNCFN